MKKLEEKSYVGWYVLLSFVLLLTMFGAIWTEVIVKRPWKFFQTRFHELEIEDAQKRYDQAVETLKEPEAQKEYQALKVKLKDAQDNFERPIIQVEYQKVLDKLIKLDKEELAPLKFEAIINRNMLQEEAYAYGHDKDDEILESITGMEEHNTELAEQIGAVESKRAVLQKKVDAFKSKITKSEKELNNFTADLDKYQKSLANLSKKRPGLQIYQVPLDAMDEVDRCMSCHPGINSSTSVSEEQPYASHPRREVYLGNHPPDVFGCVLCHEGQARATTSPEKAHGAVEFWLRPMLKGKMVQSSCITCHSSVTGLEGAEKIAEGIELFQELGCFGCHQTEGFGEDKFMMIGPSLTELGSKVNADWLYNWLMGPKSYRASTRMPNFMLEEEDAKAIASYLWQNSEGFDAGEHEEFDDETIDEGAYIFESVGCLACHSDIEEDGKVHGPNLANIGEKVNFEYLVSWLLDPKSHQPNTSMPNFRLDDESARFLAAFLTTLTSEDYEVKDVESDWISDEDLAEQGKSLIGRYGCFGCHEIRGMEDRGKIGVELSEVGSKHIHLFDFGLKEHDMLHELGIRHPTENVAAARRSWIEAKLTDPRQFDEGRYKKPSDRLRMPNFSLTKEEVEAVSTVLLGMREGEMPEVYRAQPSEEKDSIYEGRRIVSKYNCTGCHQFSIDTLYLTDGIVLKGMVKLEEEDNLFFQLWEDNDDFGRKAGETAQIQTSQIKNRTYAEGGDIGSFIIDYHVEVEGRVAEEANVFTPPVLYQEGRKVQSAWLFDFLKEPIPLRPWLDVRMPTFKLPSEEATSLSSYFAILEGEEYPFEFIRETTSSYIAEKEEVCPGYLADAMKLFESKDVNCASCHVRGTITPDGEPSSWAPDLSLAKERLRPEWIKRWLMDPQLIQPGTKMPKLFREGVFQDIFPGQPEEQAEALKDLLMNFPVQTAAVDEAELDE
ncbi:MAG: c-type cytochrome [Planctomycetes bacterium]|nr:c-type cytochrome [Planctomycetota bacterium]